VPVNRQGYHTNGYDLKNAMPFNKMLEDNPKRLYYNFSLQNNFCVIDLDKCFKPNGEIETFAKQVIDEFKDLNPYIEYSMSRNGLHVILTSTDSFKKLGNVEVKLKNTHEKYSNLHPKAGIEILQHQHCITLTGDVYNHFQPKSLGKTTKVVREFFNRVKTLSQKNIDNLKASMKKKLENKTVDIDDVFGLIKSKVSINQVFEHYKIYVTNNGNINCPFPGHQDNTPSFTIYNYSDSFYCHGCKSGGTIIDFVMVKEQCRNLEAAKKLNEWFELGLDFDTYSKNIDHDWVLIGDDDKVYVDLTILRDHITNDHHVVYTEQALYYYNEGKYQEIQSTELKLLIENHMPTVYNNKFKKSNYVDEVYLQLKRNFKTYKMFNKDQHLANFKNCSVRLTPNTDDIEIVNHNPENLITYQCAGNYNPDEKCDTWQKFLNETLPEEQQKLLQEIMGYTLIMNNRAKKFFGFYGVGDTGKSVILRTITNILGMDYVSAVPLQNLTSKRTKFEVATLVNKMANICGDIPSSPIEDSNIVKQLTGDDPIFSEKKHKDGVVLYNTARLIFSMNFLPASYDKSMEFFKRFIIIPFTNPVPEDKQDKHLIEKFNIDGVIAWAMTGLRRLIKNNLVFSETVTNKDLIQQYIKMDAPGLDFVDEFCEVTGNSNDHILQNNLMKYFKYFCNEIIGQPMTGKMSTKKLVSQITTRYTETKYRKNLNNPLTNSKNGRGISNIRIKDEFLKEFEAFKNINPQY